MRTLAFVVLLALLAVSASAIRLSPVGSASVAVPYKWCGAAGDDATIDSIYSNEFPPVKGDTLSLNVTGNLTKVVTSGTYTIAISVSGFPLPSITGDIDAFSPLPWELGQLNFTYSQLIPSEAPPGSYQVKISAVDQDSKQIFCITIAFSLSALPGQQAADVRLIAGHKAPHSLQADTQLALEGAIKQRPTPTINLRTAASNNGQQRIRPQHRMPPMRPIKPINRRR